MQNVLNKSEKLKRPLKNSRGGDRMGGILSSGYRLVYFRRSVIAEASKNQALSKGQATKAPVKEPEKRREGRPTWARVLLQSSYGTPTVVAKCPALLDLIWSHRLSTGCLAQDLVLLHHPKLKEKNKKRIDEGSFEKQKQSKDVNAFRAFLTASYRPTKLQCFYETPEL
jgi:hypothetical protein